MFHSNLCPLLFLSQDLESALSLNMFIRIQAVVHLGINY